MLSHNLKEGTGSYNDVIGQVKNIGTDPVEFVKIGLTVHDKNGDIVGTDSTYADPSTLEPDQKSSFSIFSSKDNFDGMASYELSLQWRDSDGVDQYVDNAKTYSDDSTHADSADSNGIAENVDNGTTYTDHSTGANSAESTN